MVPGHNTLPLRFLFKNEGERICEYMFGFTEKKVIFNHF